MLRVAEKFVVEPTSILQEFRQFVIPNMIATLSFVMICAPTPGRRLREKRGKLSRQSFVPCQGRFSHRRKCLRKSSCWRLVGENLGVDLVMMGLVARIVLVVAVVWLRGPGDGPEDQFLQFQRNSEQCVVRATNRKEPPGSTDYLKVGHQDESRVIQIMYNATIYARYAITISLSEHLHSHFTRNLIRIFFELGNVSMKVDPERIAHLVQSEFQKLPAKRKPAVRSNGLHEWVPLSGIVAQDADGQLFCLSMA